MRHRRCPRWSSSPNRVGAAARGRTVGSRCFVSVSGTCALRYMHAACARQAGAVTTTPDLAAVTAALTAPGAPFEMEDQDVRGVALRTWKNAPPTLREVLEASRAHGDARVPRVRRRGAGCRRRAVRPADVRRAPRRRGRLRPPPHRRRRHPGRRPRGHRHAQLPRVVHRLLGAPPPPAPSSCRSTPGGRARSSSTACPTRAAGCSSPTRAGRAARRPPAASCRPSSARSSCGQDRPDHRPAPSPSRRCSAPCDRRRRPARRRHSTPRTTPRSSTRRARPASRRARSARTATSARTS